MQRLRELLTIVLLGLLPLHAFFVTVGTNVLAGPGHAPLTVLALWKEAVLGVILLIALIEWLKKPRFSLDILDWIILGLLALSVIVTARTHADWNVYLIGFKYDFVPLIAFLALRRVEWSDQFSSRLLKILLIVAAVVSVYGILSMYMHQQFFTWLGYSDLHSLYQPDAPLAAFQKIGGTAIRRIQSTMSGPNQLGLWLLIPLSIALVRKNAVGVFIVFAMMLTLSRSALLAAGVFIAVILWRQLPRKKFFQFAAAMFCLSFVLSIVAYFFAADIIVRKASTSDHISRPLAAIQIIKENPLGLGLGTAGPASNRTSGTCVFLSEGSDASWAQVHTNLCVFVGDVQVQPEDKACACPVLPENWYLQIGLEMGILGFALFIALVILILKKLPKNSPVFLAFLGISIASLFLHAWEDAAVAYTVWVLAAVMLRKSTNY